MCSISEKFLVQLFTKRCKKKKGMNKTIFWMEALKAGTIVGLVSVAFSIAVQAISGPMPESSWIQVLNFVSVLVSLLLVYGFTRRFAAMHSVEEGFSYGQGVKFVLALMLFVGVLSGIYSAVMANFFIKEELLASVDTIMAQMQDAIPADQFEATYDTMRGAVINPMILTISNVLSNLFTGLLFGVVVAAITRRQPDIFATPVVTEEEKPNDQE